MVERKRWSQLVQAGDWFHLARIQFLPLRLSRLHTHDFPEIFWIEAGEGMHEINGEMKRLSCGDLVFVRSSDTHVLRAANQAAFTLVNLAFSARVLAELAERHAEILRLFRERGELPVRWQLSPSQLRQLKDEVRRLGAGGQNRMLLERFLLGVFLLRLPVSQQRASSAPEWLERACAAMERPECFAEGVPAFVRSAGRSPEHVARACRRYLGVSPTEFVNRLRMEHAARELRLGAKPILGIALECGINNLAHFYTLFRAAHGETPLRYRLASQRSAV